LTSSFGYESNTHPHENWFRKQKTHQTFAVVLKTRSRLMAFQRKNEQTLWFVDQVKLGFQFANTVTTTEDEPEITFNYRGN
jgi:hypothetical protein